jgi:hypothetical protein
MTGFQTQIFDEQLDSRLLKEVGNLNILMLEAITQSDRPKDNGISIYSNFTVN